MANLVANVIMDTPIVNLQCTDLALIDGEVSPPIQPSHEPKAAPAARSHA